MTRFTPLTYSAKGRYPLKLNECLNHASVQTLRGIAIDQKLDCSLHSKHDLMQTILGHMQWRTALEDQVRQWSQRWGEMMRRMVMSGRTQFSTEEVDALFLTGSDKGLALKHALSEGWLFARQGIGVRPNYVIPEEVLSAAQQNLREEWTRHVVCRASPPLIQRDEGTAMAGDLQTFLDYVRHHDVQLTTGGSMYKRHIQQLMELFEIREDIEVPEWRFGYGRRTYDYPDRLALLYDFAYAQSFLIEEPEGLLRVSESALTWQSVARPIQLQRLLHFYLRTYRRPIPRLRDIVEIIRSTSERWSLNESVFEVCKPLVNAFYYDTPLDVWVKRIRQMLTHLGIIRIGVDEESTQEWFQMTELGQELLTQDESNLLDEKPRAQASLIVQPNFDIMVTVPNGILEAVLAQFTDLKSSGAIRIYRILQHTVERGLSLGYDVVEWKSMLATHGLGPVPGNVERMLDEWIRSHVSASHSKSS